MLKSFSLQNFKLFCRKSQILESKLGKNFGALVDFAAASDVVAFAVAIVADVVVDAVDVVVAVAVAIVADADE